MKNIFIAFAAVAVLIIGFILITGDAETNVETTNTDTSSAKLDIAAICQGALAYMTFPDSAAAESFVEACKEGQHPEVIERYKSEMGLGDGAAI